VAAAFERGIGRRIEVGAAAEQLRDVPGERVDDRGAGGTSREGAALDVLGLEGRKVAVPVAGQLMRLRATELRSELRRLVQVLVEALLPFALQLSSAIDRRAEVAQRLVGNEERFLCRPAQLLLGGLDFIGAQRTAMCLERAGLVRTAVADRGVDDNQ